MTAEGVGKAVEGRGGITFLVSGKLTLTGVIGESLFVSVVATDRFLILRLDEDKFFLTVPWGGIIFATFAGDGGITTESSALP